MVKRRVLWWGLLLVLCLPWPSQAVLKVAVGILPETIEADAGLFRVSLVITPAPARVRREAVGDVFSVRLSNLADCPALVAALKAQVITHVETLWQTTVTAAEIAVFGACQ